MTDARAPLSRTTPVRGRARRRSSTSWPSGRAPPAGARGCGRSRSRSRSAAARSPTWSRLHHQGGARVLRRRSTLSEREAAIARRILKEIRERLGFLVNVGLDYLTLDRRRATLSGGEGQRIRLATQIGSSLVGVLYILDEPSIGLHQRDNRAAARHAQAAARPRQHRARRRARRGDDPRGRLS